MLEEGSTRLATAMNNRKFNEIRIADNSKIAILQKQLIVNSENLNRLRKKQMK